MANFLQLQTDVFTRLGQVYDGNDEVLTVAVVKDALNLAYGWLAREARLFLRNDFQPLADDQAEYTLPPDMVDITAVRWGTQVTPLTRKDVNQLEWETDPAWRDRAKSTPYYWVPLAANRIALYPPPTVATALSLKLTGHVVPLAVGGSIATVARASEIVTVTCTAQHHLTVGASVIVSGVTSSAFNGTFTVLSAPSDLAFTVAQAGANASSTLGYIRYAGGGALPLIADADVPDFPALHHEALTLRAALHLAATALATDARAQAATAALTGMLDEAVRSLKASSAGW
jgi:hypothetical protein